MAGWLTLMVVIAVAGREAARELSVFQVMLLRSTLGMAMLWPLVRSAGGLTAVRTKRLPQHVLRNAVHYAAQYGWFVALTLIPLAHVVSIEFTMPIWSAALAVVFLGERMSGRKWFAVLLGLVGVAVIVRPRAGGLDAGQLIALASALGFAVSVVLVKSLTRTDAAVAIKLLDAGGAERDRAHPGACGLAMALGDSLGLGGGGGLLRHLLALLLRQRDAACGRHGCRADGLPARTVDRARGLDGVLGTAGSLHGDGRRPDPGRQRAEPASLAGWRLAGPAQGVRRPPGTGLAGLPALGGEAAMREADHRMTGCGRGGHSAIRAE
jgi:drug/metabolite transporter (DMT)-like permease